MRHLKNPSRSMAPFQYYGGKGNLLPFILPHLAGPETVYVEPYCGAASVLFAKQPHLVEVLNDLDGEVVNVFRVLQDREQFREFAHRVRWTPYSLAEFRRALATQRNESASQVDRAWAMFVRQNQAMSEATCEGNWSRTFVARRGMAHNTNSWRLRLSLLRHWHDRLTRVQIDCRDALEVIRYWDSPDTVFYLDPPYVSGTRVARKRKVYAQESDDAYHLALVETILSCRGRAILSGYDTPLYSALESAGWAKLKRSTVCHAAGRARNGVLRGNGAALAKVPRTEVLWMNRPGDQARLF